MSIEGRDILGRAEGVSVAIRDLSGANGAEPIEVVRGFTSLAHANAFARRRVRDSIELCRAPGTTAEQLRDAWFAFGEDAEVQGAGEAGWRSARELAAFLATPCRDAEERNWRVLDPRADAEERESEEEA
ncbi:MAG: hypothetical protein N3D18_08110 [Roseococcus sp.]|nr:hypothetical protein [Roseococcus sp.]